MLCSIKNPIKKHARLLLASNLGTDAPTVAKSNKEKKKKKEFDKLTFSGIQPTSIPHLGNYFGAVKQWVNIQNEATNTHDSRLVVSIVDLHAITAPQEPKILNDYIYKCAATLLACGIDPSRTVLYQQSQVPFHGQLAWILGCKVTMPQLGQMHQFKFKSNGLAQVPLGLYTYPVLQAADILLFKATHVPVGEDQLQHIELCREIAIKFNNFFKYDFFPIPISIQSDCKRLRSLRDPSKKMSKSDADNGSRIQLTDTPDLIMKKIRKAVTDSKSLVSYEPIERPGVSTLIDIESACTGADPEDIVETCFLRSMDTGEYKKHVADVLVAYLKPIQEKYMRYISDKQFLKNIIDEGGEHANQMAAKTFNQLEILIGTKL